jgi:hypothetical protein
MSNHMKHDGRGRFVSKDGTPAPLPEPGRKIKRGPTTIKHYRVDRVLVNKQQQAEYEKLLANPNTTALQLQDFLRAHGHGVCRSAVQHHRNNWNSELKRLREVARMASSFCELSRSNGSGSVAEASHAMFEMELMQSLFNLPGAKEMPAGQWQTMSKTLQGVVATRRSVEEMRNEFEAKAREAAQAVEKAAGDGTSTADVVERVKSILGV